MSVSIVCGADELELDELVGLEFSGAVPVARRAMTIPDDITDVRLNGRENVDGTTIVNDDDIIYFYKKSGVKGC